MSFEEVTSASGNLGSAFTALQSNCAGAAGQVIIRSGGKTAPQFWVLTNKRFRLVESEKSGTYLDYEPSTADSACRENKFIW